MARGRRVNSCGEKSKKLLLEKAIELFSTYGYHQTKISDIVKSANLTQPTFYLYFQSKETLFNDLNEKFRNELTEIFSGSNDMNDGKFGIEVIQEGLVHIFDYFIENPNLTKIGFYEAEQSTAVKEMLVSKLTHILNTQLQNTGAVKLVDANILAESFVGSVERLTLTNLLTNKSKPEQLAKEICMIYFATELSLVHS
ncbi:TetR/AcrR family transcriptional regulator [Solibacillus sp. FSL W7-1436]|uniref:TetR/AcrR family transcriptional regulator n=1 Tax=Solibacillus sp. FSL W7-1436 TaxID=2921705 RepID=UPI0030FBBC4B